MREPPFDGSPACPMCPGDARNLSACAHNVAVRLVGGAAFGCAWGDRVYSLKCAVDDMEPRAQEFVPEVQALIVAGRALLDAWPEQPPDVVAAFIAARAPVEVLSEAHFASSMHSHGRL